MGTANAKMSTKLCGGPAMYVRRTVCCRLRLNWRGLLKAWAHFSCEMLRGRHEFSSEHDIESDLKQILFDKCRMNSSDTGQG